MIQEELEKNWRNPDGTLKEGHPAMGGRPKGTRDFTTDFDEAVAEIAKEEKITVSEARKELLKVAYHQAKKGNYNFYKDTIDRNYGSIQQKADITSGGDKIQPILVRFLNKENGEDS